MGAVEKGGIQIQRGKFCKRCKAGCCRLLIIYASTSVGAQYENGNMPNAMPGVLVSCDVPIKEFLVWLSENQNNASFIIEDVDDTHVFVTEAAVPFIMRELEKLYDENQYTNIN